MPTIVGGIRRIKGGGRDVAACFASRIESLETDEGGGHAGEAAFFYPPRLDGYKRKTPSVGREISRA